MKVLMIGSDRNLFKKDSDIWNRYLDYGKLFEEIHVIVFSAKKLGNKSVKIGDNVFVHPTDHICKFFYLWNVYQISKQIFNSLSSVVGRLSWVASAQDAFESGLAGCLVKKIYGIPLQIQVHTDFLSPYFWKESLINKLRVILAKFLIPRADGVRVVSERIRQSLVTCRLSLVAKIIVLPIQVDIDKIQAAPIVINLHIKYPQFNFIILMASRLTEEKNIGMAIEAMGKLVRKYPKIGLVIVGFGSELESCKSLVISRGLENSVIFEPAVNSQMLFSYYKSADLFLLTSNYEGYGRTIIEAMAAGLPVIMTDVGLAGESVINGQNGVVVPVEDNGAIVDSISSLIVDMGKKDRLSGDALKIIEKITTKEHYLELYKQSIESCVIND